MCSWIILKNHRKVSNLFPGLILCGTVLNETLFTMHNENLKIRHSQHVSASKKFEKMRKIALFHGILARKVPRLQFPRPIFLPLIKHNISYFLYQNIQILMIHFFGPPKRKIENDHFLEIYCTFPNLPGKLKILLKVTKHLNIMW